MESRSPAPSIRECRDRLVRALDEPSAGRDEKWYADLNDSLEQLDQSLADGEFRQNRSEYLTQISRAHPRLIAVCDEFQTDGRKLLRHATLVVRLSARNFDAGKAPFPELRDATTSLIDAVGRYLVLEGELRGEALRDLGGEG